MLESKLYAVMLIPGILALPAVAGAGTAPTPARGLEDTRWILESYGESGNLPTSLEGAEITALFDSGEGQVRRSAGANNYFGSYRMSNNKVSIQQIAQTEMYCLDPEGVIGQERQ